MRRTAHPALRPSAPPVALDIYSRLEKAPWWLLLFPAHHHLAFWTNPHGLRGDAGVVCKSQVHYSALIGRHGLQGDGLSGIGHPLSDALSKGHQGLVTPLLVSLNVHHQVGPGLQPPPDNELDQELEGSEGLAPSSDEEARVLTFDLEDWTVKVFPMGLFQVNHCGDAEGGYYILQDLCGYLHHVGGLLEQSDPHTSGFAAYAQNSRLTPANDVYFDRGAIYVELF